MRAIAKTSLILTLFAVAPCLAATVQSGAGSPAVSIVDSLPDPELRRLVTDVLDRNPRLAEVQALIDAAEVRVELAERERQPDLRVGLSYGFVGKRDDAAGRLSPPEGTGDDILGLAGGINLPIWRDRLAAGVDEAVQQRLAAEESRRAIIAEIDGDLASLAGRAPLIREQVQLFDEILVVQAEEALRSAESAYASGTAGTLDLLDAERTLLQVRIGAERARTDLAVTVAKLEGDLAVTVAKLEGVLAGSLAAHRDGGAS